MRAGLTQAEAARLSGVKQSDISKIERGETERPAGLLALARAYQCDPNWLDSGDGMAPWDTAHSQGNTSPVALGRSELVPLISWVQAGEWSGIVDNFQPGDADEWLPCPVRHSGHTYALTVRGSSMHNPAADLSFKDGDTIFVDPDREAMHRSLVVVRLDDDKEATFKQLIIEGREMMLQALNPQWPERIMKIDGRASISGVVIGKLESFI